MSIRKFNTLKEDILSPNKFDLKIRTSRIFLITLPKKAPKKRSSETEKKRFEEMLDQYFGSSQPYVLDTRRTLNFGKSNIKIKQSANMRKSPIKNTENEHKNPIEIKKELENLMYFLHFY